MNDSPTPTPRSDAELLVGSNTLNQGAYVRLSFARVLELELNSAKSELEQFKKSEREFPTHHSIESRQITESAVENSRFVIELMEYAHHGPCCPRHQEGHNRSCDCGLKELMDKIEATSVKPAV